MTGRDELEAALRASASAPVPEVDPAFADRLEQRLMATAAAPASNVVPLARRARRYSATAVLTGSLIFAGAAAAAGVVIIRHHDTPSAPVVTTIPNATVVVITTTTVASTTTEHVTPTTHAPVTVPVTDPVTTTTVHERTTTTTVHETPTTTTVRETTTTTEPKVPQSISLACRVDGTTVRCDWSGGDAGASTYVVLRTQTGQQGRAYSVPVATKTWSDPLATAGSTASYMVDALDASGKVLGHSNLVTLGCC